MGVAKNISPATALRKTDTVALLLKGFLLQDVTGSIARVLCPRLLHACEQHRSIAGARYPPNPLYFCSTTPPYKRSGERKRKKASQAKDRERSQTNYHQNIDINGYYQY